MCLSLMFDHISASVHRKWTKTEMVWLLLMNSSFLAKRYFFFSLAQHNQRIHTTSLTSFDVCVQHNRTIIIVNYKMLFLFSQVERFCLKKKIITIKAILCTTY